MVFRSLLVPPYVRKGKRVEAALPWLYLKGISTGQMQEALKVLAGPDATGLYAAMVSRLKREWEIDYAAWSKRELGKDCWVYLWADGSYSGLPQLLSSYAPSLCETQIDWVTSILTLGDTGKSAIVKGLIWASLIAAALNRYMAHSTQLAAQVEISTQRTAMSASHFVITLMQVINSKCNQRIDQAVESAMRRLAVNARRAHPKRDRRTGRTSAGLLAAGVPNP